MKKAISILLVLVMCFGMCGCAGETKSNEIKLTLANYKDYLSLKYWTGFEDEWEHRSVMKLTGGEYTKYFYSTIYGYGKAEATTTNFNFNNVKIVLRVKGSTIAMTKLPPWGLTGDEVTVPFDFQVTIETNIAGNGEGEMRFTLPNNLATDNRCGTGTGRTPSAWCTIEIIEIQGTVTPV